MKELIRFIAPDLLVLLMFGKMEAIIGNSHEDGGLCLQVSQALVIHKSLIPVHSIGNQISKEF